MTFSNARRTAAVKMLFIAAAAATLGSAARAHDGDEGNDDRDAARGKIFMSTNATAGNAVQVYSHPRNAPAVLLATVPTGGTGTGAGLGSQGSVTLSSSGKYLFVVNAGSSSVSTFRLGGQGLTLVSTVASGGQRPISVSESDGIVYVLNAPAAGTGNTVVGFRNDHGTLVPLADGVRALPDNSAPAQVQFDNDGDALVVSLKTATQLVSWKVGRNGVLAAHGTATPSPGAVPFGFGITRQNVVVVSEAGTSSASSYTIGRHDAALHLVSPAVGNGQGAACWVAVTPDGRFAFTANAATSNISSYAVERDGRISLLLPQAGVTSNNGAVDMAITPDGKQLHVFASRAPQQIVSFTIHRDGSLTKLGALNVSAGAGIAAN